MRTFGIRAYLTIAMIALALSIIAALSYAMHTWARNVIRARAVETLGSLADERRSAVLRIAARAERSLGGFLREAPTTCGTGPQALPCIEDRLRVVVQYLAAEGATALFPGTGAVKVGSVSPTASATPHAFETVWVDGAPRRLFVTTVSIDGATARIAKPALRFDEVFPEGSLTGQTGRSYLVDQAGRVVTSAPALRGVTDRHGVISSPPLTRCLDGRDGEALAPNFQDAPYVHAFRSLRAIGGGCVMVQMTQAEAFAPVARLTRRVLVTIPLVVALAIIVSILAARWLTAPIETLARCATAVRDGDLTARARADRGPAELRELCQTFSVMVDALRESAAFKERFLGILGHDLRNPLSAIRMAAGTLARRQDAPPEVAARAVALISRSGERMNRLVGQLLDFARIREHGTIPLHRSQTDLGALVTGVVDELRVAYPRHTVQVATSGDVSGAWDADRLAQVASNLVGNAIQHSSLDQRTIQVEVRDAGAEVVFSVHNRGPAIPDDLVPQLFRPYRQATDERKAGVGLGLYVVERIVAAHGGTVEVASSARDGNTFTVRLPRGDGRAGDVRGAARPASPQIAPPA